MPLLRPEFSGCGSEALRRLNEREYRRHSRRFARMAAQLKQLQYQMNEAQSLPQIRQIAANVEQSMREESNDWFGVMRFHDIELIT